MITCTLRDKKYSIDFVSGRALRELEPAAQMYAKVVRLSELAAKGQTIPEDAKFIISEAMDNGIERDAPQYSVFTQMIVCDKCGKYYRRKVSRTETAWNCSTYLTMGKAHCHTKQVPEDILMKSAAAVLGLTQFDEAVFRNQIQEIRVPCFNHLVFVFKDGRHEERIWQDKSRASSWTDEMRAQAAENAHRR